MKTLGIDLGGTQIKYGVLEHCELLENSQCDTPAGTKYNDVLSKIINITTDVLSRHNDIGHIGLAAPGLIDTHAGVIRYSNNLAWSEVFICNDIKIATGKNVRIANDAQCATLGEALYGAGAEYSRVAMLTIGTGVGGGFICNKKIEGDDYGSMAYIFGHSVIEYDGKPCNCGRIGCLEAYASASAIAKQKSKKTMSVKEIFDNARMGDELSCEIVREFLEYLSVGVVNMANILRPHVIVIGGGVSASWDLMMPTLSNSLQKGVYGFPYAPVQVVPAKLGNKAGIVGAASL